MVINYEILTLEISSRMRDAQVISRTAEHPERTLMVVRFYETTTSDHMTRENQWEAAWFQAVSVSGTRLIEIQWLASDRVTLNSIRAAPS